jgi:hypothetical protein
LGWGSRNAFTSLGCAWSIALVLSGGFFGFLGVVGTTGGIAIWVAVQISSGVPSLEGEEAG